MPLPTPGGEGNLAAPGLKGSAPPADVLAANLRKSEGPRGAVRRYTTGQDALTREEVDQLLRQPSTMAENALLHLALATGVRREDLVSIERKDLDLVRGVVTFWEAKKRRPWKAWVGGRAKEILAMHVANLRAHHASCPWLFPSPVGDPAKHLSSRAAYDVLQRGLRGAGLRRRPFHSLRSTAIKLMQAAGWSIEQVMAQTGDTWRTIQEHYATPSDDEMAAAATGRPVL